MSPSRAFLLPCALLALLAASCREAKVNAYRAPKDPPSSPTAGSDDLAWTAPSDWESQPASAMRKATYYLKDASGAQAELSITELLDDGGGELANLNRWRDQIKLPALTMADSASGVTRLDQAGLHLTLADFSTLPPLQPQRMLGVIVPFHNVTWFFKLSGPAALLDQKKAAFLTFISTIRPAAPASAAAVSTAPSLPKLGGPGNAMAGTTVPVATGTSLSWTAPAVWRAQPATSMRKATFAITGEAGAQAELAITAFPGEVGGELENLNRWRDLVQLPKLADAATVPGVTRFEQGGLKFTVADFSSVPPAPPSRILGAIVPVGTDTWFFKLTGPPALIEQQKGAFLAFLHTVKAP